LARKTLWAETSPGIFHGFGQRLLTTPAGEHPLMDVRTVRLGQSEANPAAAGSASG
jgi:type VI secretion system protein ImpE